MTIMNLAEKKTRAPFRFDGRAAERNFERNVSIVKNENDLVLAIDHSVLLDGEQATNMEKAHWVYNLVLPFMLAVSLWHMLTVRVWRFFYLLTKGRPTSDVQKREYIFGPKNLSFWFDRIHPLANRVRNSVQTPFALDTIYVQRNLPVRNWRDWVLHFWLEQPDGVGVTNRLKMTFNRMQEALRLLYEQKVEEIRMVSLACGSAEASIQALANFHQRYPEHAIHLDLVDLNGDALKAAMKLAVARGVSDMVCTHQMKLREFLSTMPDNHFHLVECVGFKDYQKNQRIVELTADIRQKLTPQGWLISAMIAPSKWAFVVEWVINWHGLNRRSRELFQRLLEQAFNYEGDVVESVLEPNRIHSVAVCRKAA